MEKRDSKRWEPKVRLFFLNRSYYPDVEATGQLLSELCSDLARVHEVIVIAGQPNFVETNRGRGWLRREQHAGVTIVRVRNIRFTKATLLGRAVGLATYVVLALWARLRTRRPDVVITETDPPFLGLIGAVLKCWHSCRLV